ncbi:MAG: DUF1015 family protein [Lachnospiraceae bacterium]|jgi:uncharacterized protein (DUF1015 family)|nr:DUF1015 family protein [Lachnospiraceae bacterium]
MPTITPFSSVRPRADLADRIAALPYDVYNRAEAAAIVTTEPLSFLRIDRAETNFPDDVGPYDDRVYDKARELMEHMIADQSFIIDDQPAYYIYELTMNGRTQTGLVACSAIEDYENNLIKKHEKTRTDKELDRICHVDITNAHTGPIFLVYRSHKYINTLIDTAKQSTPEYDFTSDDDIRHRVWILAETTTIDAIKDAFADLPATYIADGHHRCASAVKVGFKRRAANPDHTGTEEYNRFLSVLFPDDQLCILPYNRVVADLNGLTTAELLSAIKDHGFTVDYMGNQPVTPVAKGTFGMYLEDGWYQLTAAPSLHVDDPVDGLDVSLLQNHLLQPILGINDPKTDGRIDFVGGIRGLGELEKRVANDMTVAFSLYPTSIEELLTVADADLLMPPKSTWFEPKLRSGLFIHPLS